MQCPQTCVEAPQILPGCQVCPLACIEPARPLVQLAPEEEHVLRARVEKALCQAARLQRACARIAGRVGDVRSRACEARALWKWRWAVQVRRSRFKQRLSGTPSAGWACGLTGYFQGAKYRTTEGLK